MSIEIIITGLASAGFGFALGAVWFRGQWVAEHARCRHLESELGVERDRSRQALEQQKDTYERLVQDLKLTEDKLRSSFTAVATSVLDKNTERFRESAEKDLRQIKTEGAADLDSRVNVFAQAVEDIKTRLREANEKIVHFEKDRVETYARLEQQMKQMHEQEVRLISETDRLKSALTTSSSVRGRWGELVLRNILSSSELMQHIDYEEQAGTRTADGDDLKPDFVVRLPHADQFLVIDAKTSLYESYLEGESATTEAERRATHLEFAKKCRKRVTDLSSREYQKNVSASVPYVIMFVPGEAAIRAAFDADPEIFQFAMDRKVFIASPVTIIPLLMLVANGWRQFKMSTQAADLSKAVEQVGDRLNTFVDRLSKVQKGLDIATRSWNEAVDKSWNGQQSVVRALERARELGGHIPELAAMEPMQVAPRLVDDGRSVREVAEFAATESVAADALAVEGAALAGASVDTVNAGVVAAVAVEAQKRRRARKSASKIADESVTESASAATVSLEDGPIPE
ncbi:MAG: DNA recombination protein RmuC [Bdellovibrionaceae bacterium]|nr:DNA recombination protein RmuC [Pseudobdellovibrionaceae bacterium]